MARRASVVPCLVPFVALVTAGGCADPSGRTEPEPEPGGGEELGNADFFWDWEGER